MRQFLRSILLKPVLWATRRFASRPDKERIYQALTKLYKRILDEPGKKGPLVSLEAGKGRFIIFSDQHKGARNGADDFALAESNYLAALDYYNWQEFTFINLGDSEELWENTLAKVKKYNVKTFEAEKKFISRQAYIKVFGNHDLYWGNDPLAAMQLKGIFGTDVPIYEGVVLAVKTAAKNIHVFCTHGHQGDAQSDGNWFSKFFVSYVWGPLQSYLRINPNTPAYDIYEKSLHNEIMYEWSAEQKDTLLITGHTHQPVFTSLTHLERLYKEMQFAKKNNDTAAIEALLVEIRKREREYASVSIDYLTMKPNYFNSGCCCYIDGDITGIEIDDGTIRLIKWKREEEKATRTVLEEITLQKLADQL